VVLVPVQPAGNRDLGRRFSGGLDVAPVDPDGGRTRKASALGCRLVGDQGGVDLGVDAKLGPDPLNQGQRLRVIWAVRNVEHLDHRAVGRARRRARVVWFLSLWRVHRHAPRGRPARSQSKPT
jgi:hypothetical protein